MCTVRTRAHSSVPLEGIMAEKKCAHPRCTCVAEAGKEFCSDECHSARMGDACGCNHPGCRTSK